MHDAVSKLRAKYGRGMEVPNLLGPASRAMAPNYGTPPKEQVSDGVPAAPNVATRVSPGTVPMRLRQYRR